VRAVPLPLSGIRNTQYAIRNMPSEYRLILKYADEPGLHAGHIACYMRYGGYEGLKKAFSLPPKTLAGWEDS